MNGNENIEKRLENLMSNYGDGSDGSSPTAEQWKALLKFPKDKPVTLVNFFKLRAVAEYGQGNREENNASGVEVFQKYSVMAAPFVAKAGGEFIYAGPVTGGFIGSDFDWTLVVIGAYPSPDSALALFEDPRYIETYVHRRAACERQYILVTTAMPGQ